MKRRDFLKTSTPFAVLPFALNGLPLRALGSPSIMSALHGAFVDTDHVLVLIQLNGGNDGLNTVIPVDQYTNLSKVRSNVMISQTKVLLLDDVNGTGLHPAMTGMRQMFNDGKLGIVQNVGYPNPDFSHFRSTDIWMSGSDSDEVITSGWVGRYLSQEFPNFPDGFPNSAMPDPLALQVGSVVAPVCQGLSVNMGMAISDPTTYYQLITGDTGSVPNTRAGKELDYIRTVAYQANEYGKVVKAAAEKGNNLSDKYPSTGQNRLADQLKIVAQLISGGLKTRVYVVSLGGFDTHASQVDITGGSENGAHANLLGQVSEAIVAFQDDIEKLGLDNRVLGMTFSEFGRRIASNFSYGTDHGTAAPLFLFGKHVKGKITGENPQIPSTVTAADNLQMKHDFRQVYASVLKDWFCLPETDVDTVMMHEFDTLDLLDDACTTSSARREDLRRSGNAWITNYPNPFQFSTTVRFASEGGHVNVQLIDSQGRTLRTLVDAVYPMGEHNVFVDMSDLPAGTYYCRYQRDSYQQTKAMLKVR